MIVPESTPKSPPKGDREPLLADGQAIPPAYSQYQSFPPFPDQQPQPPPVSAQRRESTAARFFKALVVGVLIWFLFGMLTSSFVWVADRRHGHSRISWPDGNTVGHPLPSDGAIHECIGGGDWTHEGPTSARTSFKLPVDSDALYVFARGSLASGRITIVDSQPIDATDDVVVSVRVKYYSSWALDRANVCQLARKEGENGVGIFTPKYWDHAGKEDRLDFDIVVYLPAGIGRNPLHIKNFETDLPIFVHESGALAKTVTFDKLSLKSSNVPIHIGTIHAEHAYVKTSNSPITGSFDTSTSLELVTTNSPISASVSMLNDPSGRETELTMITSNSHIDSEIKLLSTESSKGSYKVTTKTSNNPLKIVYKESPLDAILNHVGKTSNSPASIALHPAYEGGFHLQSSVISPIVSRGTADDPSGRGRRRATEIRKVGRNVVSGQTYWGQKKQGKTGNIELKTSNSPAQLIL